MAMITTLSLIMEQTLLKPNFKLVESKTSTVEEEACKKPT